MRGLTLHQPWASMVAIGDKLIETRSWTTAYRGPLAIHAAKSYPTYAKHFAMTSRFVRARLADLAELSAAVPFGAVVAVAELVSIEPTEDAERTLSGKERALGNYGPGRYAWRLADVRPLRHPYPLPGKQGLWSVFERDVENILASVERR